MDNNPLKIDLDQLEEDWQKHSNIVKEYSDKLADYRMELDQAEEELKVQTAEAELDIRMKGPAEYNLDKFTEGTITALLQIHPKLQEIRQRIIQKKHDVRIAEGFTNSLEHRKKALENEVQLYIAGYWSLPRTPRENRTEMEKTGRDRTFDRAKKALNKKGK